MSKMLPNSKSSPTTGLISKSNIFLLVVLFVVIGVSFFNDFVEIETVQSPCPTPPPPPGQPQNIIAKRQSALPGQVCLSSVYGCFNWQSLTKTDEERMAVMVLPKDEPVLEPVKSSKSFDLLRSKVQAAQPLRDTKLHIDDRCSASKVFHDSATAFTDDIDAILSELAMPSVYGDAKQEVAFSVLNIAYVFALKQHYSNAQKFLPHKIFYVALDVESAQALCQMNIPFISYSAKRIDLLHGECKDCPPLPPTRRLAAHIALAKFEPVKAMLARDIASFFYEMDVFVVRSLEYALKPYAGAWLTVGGHLDFCSSPNIGIYRVLPASNTTRMFDFLLLGTLLAPELHDQNLFICAMYHMIEDPRKCGGMEQHMSVPFFYRPAPRSLDVRDPKLPWFRAHYEAFFSANEKLATYDATLVVSVESPLPSNNVAMMHYLSGAPLRVPGAKAMIAKEMGAWGDDEYFGAGRYLALDDSFYAAHGSVWQQENSFLPGMLNTLITLAIMTDRILIFPTIIGRWRFIHAFEYIDVRYLDKLGVQWRESSFLSNKRVAASVFDNAARLIALPDGVGVQSYTQQPHIAWHKSVSLEREDSEVLYQKFRSIDYLFESFSTLCQTATTPRSKGGVDDASLLLISWGDMHRTPISMLANYITPELRSMLARGNNNNKDFVTATTTKGREILSAAELLVDVMTLTKKVNGMCDVSVDSTGSRLMIPVTADRVCAHPQFKWPNE